MIWRRWLYTAGTTGPTSTALSYLPTDRDRICRIRHGDDSGTACNVTYDEVGSIVAQATPTGQRQYSYFADGSVRTITDNLGSAAQFRYDAFGEIQELGVTSSASQDTRRDRRYGSLFAWRDATTGSSILSRKVVGPDGSIATRRGAGGPWVFELGEARGNRFFVDQDGAFVQDVDYQPYGTPTTTGEQPGSPLYSSEQWNGGDLLAAFGISQLGARLYDPAIGRFLSRDPLLIPRTAATTNPYAFADNDPVNRSDPTGLCTSGPKLLVDEGEPCQSEDGGSGGGTRGSLGSLWLHSGSEPGEYHGSGGGGSGSSTRGPVQNCVNGICGGASAGKAPAKQTNAGAGASTDPWADPWADTPVAKQDDWSGILFPGPSLADFYADVYYDQIVLGIDPLTVAVAERYRRLTDPTLADLVEDKIDDLITAVTLVAPEFLPLRNTVSDLAKRSLAGELLAANRMAGNLLRDKIAAIVQASGRQVRTEVYKRTLFGPRYIDIEVSLNGKILGGIEVKLGNSPYLPSQRAKDMWLWLVEGYRVNVLRSPR
jgi:RHS repeat-associated protein